MIEMTLRVAERQMVKVMIRSVPRGSQTLRASANIVAAPSRAQHQGLHGNQASCRCVPESRWCLSQQRQAETVVKGSNSTQNCSLHSQSMVAGSGPKLNLRVR